MNRQASFFNGKEASGTTTGKFGLLTLARNEESNLIRLAESIARQTLRPAQWLIVDDASSDGTHAAASAITAEWNWVTVEKLRSSSWSLDERFGRLCNWGFRKLEGLLAKEEIEPEFLIKVDADIVLMANCFERLVHVATRDSLLGVVGPNLGHGPPTTSRKRYPLSRFMLPQEPPDGVRLYRAECLQDIGGVPETQAPDVVALREARNRGWKTKRIRETLAWKVRPTGGSFRSKRLAYLVQGRRRAALGYSLPFVFASSMLQVLIDADLRALGMLFGYLDSHQRREGDADLHLLHHENLRLGTAVRAILGPKDSDHP